MATQAQVANLWRFLRGDSGSPEVFTSVPEVITITPGAAEAPDLDATSLDSSARETKPGLTSYATFTVEMIFVPNNAVQHAMADEIPTSTSRHFRVMDPTQAFGLEYTLTPATFNYTGFGVDQIIHCIATFKQAGKPTRIGAF
jgi:hypothetical protein